MGWRGKPLPSEALSEGKCSELHFKKKLFFKIHISDINQKKGCVTMAYGIMRVQKVNGGGNLKGLCNEHDRTASMKDKAESEEHFSASKINWEKTDSNIVLKREYEHKAFQNSAWKYEKNLLEEIGINPRKNAVLMYDTLYTASPEFFKEKSQEEVKAYFESCLKFHEKEWGTVVDAVVHMDEKTPHLHILSIPLVDDPERGFKLSAKQICDGRVAMRNKQDKFFEDVSKQYGLVRGEVKDFKEIKKHETSQGFRVKELNNRMDELTNFIKEQYSIFEKDLDIHKEEVRGLDEELNKKANVINNINAINKQLKLTQDNLDFFINSTNDSFDIDLRQWRDLFQKEIFEKFANTIRDFSDLDNPDIEDIGDIEE